MSEQTGAERQPGTGHNFKLKPGYLATYVCICGVEMVGDPRAQQPCKFAVKPPVITVSHGAPAGVGPAPWETPVTGESQSTPEPSPKICAHARELIEQIDNNGLTFSEAAKFLSDFDRRKCCKPEGTPGATSYVHPVNNRPMAEPFGAPFNADDSIVVERDDESIIYGLRDEVITHWQPLPEPPSAVPQPPANKEKP